MNLCVFFFMVLLFESKAFIFNSNDIQTHADGSVHLFEKTQHRRLATKNLKTNSDAANTKFTVHGSEYVTGKLHVDDIATVGGLEFANDGDDFGTRAIAKMRAMFTAGTGITITEGEIGTTITQSSNTDTQLTTAQVRAMFSPGTGITITDGEIITNYGTTAGTALVGDTTTISSAQASRITATANEQYHLEKMILVLCNTLGIKYEHLRQAVESPAFESNPYKRFQQVEINNDVLYGSDSVSELVPTNTDTNGLCSAGFTGGGNTNTYACPTGYIIKHALSYCSNTNCSPNNYDIGGNCCTPLTPYDSELNWATTAAFTFDQNLGDAKFGRAISLTDNWAIIGAKDARKAFIFQNTGGTWSTTAAFALENGGIGVLYYGSKVAMTDNWAVVGAYGSRKVYGYKNTAGSWGTSAAFTLNIDVAYFGASISMTDNWIFVGSTDTAIRKIFIYKNTAGTWGTTPAFTLDQNTATNGFAGQVSITDNWAIVGASGSKKAFIFKNTGGTWASTAAFVLDQNTGDSGFGCDVSISDNWAVVGAHAAKKAFVFKNTAGTWGNTAAFVFDQNTADTYFGLSVSITENWAMIGAGFNSAQTNKAFIFKNTGGVWDTSPAFTLDQNTGTPGFGFQVDITDNWAMTGSYDDTGGNDKAFMFKYN